ncbi:beta-ketoacyl-ACP synthase II [candidate division KSB1 bacterium]|nr:beta-ketoacyl-ACP synthase II [candidate division KSB1 bacterium]
MADRSHRRSNRRVVVTGLGAVTPLGLNVEDFWDGLIHGRSGVDRITRFDPTGFDTQIAAEVKGFCPEDFIHRKEARRMDAFTHYAMAAAAQAIEDSGLVLDKEDLDRIGVVVGSGIGGMYVFEDQVIKLQSHGPRRISPFFIPMIIADIAPGYISMKYKLKGPNYSTVSACATASHAIADATILIQRGDADAMVAGGAEAPITRMGVAGFNAMKAISTRNHQPQQASRPFDKERDGFVMGEGAGIVVLESLEHAQGRGADILAELVGIGLTADAYHITAPAPGGEGAVRAMALALKDGGLKPSDVEYINAHGTSTDYNDRLETEAIKTVFGDYAYRVHISSTKSMTGHLLGAAGGIEFIACVLAIKHSLIPPTINYEVPDPNCDLNYTPNQAVSCPVRVALSNTFGFGGHNACLALKRFL